jgi:hypothetical protein
MTPVQKEMAALAESSGINPSSATRLNNVLMQMRKVCNHPDLITSHYTQVGRSTWMPGQGPDTDRSYLELQGGCSAISPCAPACCRSWSASAEQTGLLLKSILCGNIMWWLADTTSGT